MGCVEYEQDRLEVMTRVLGAVMGAKDRKRKTAREERRRAVMDHVRQIAASGNVDAQRTLMEDALKHMAKNGIPIEFE